MAVKNEQELDHAKKFAAKGIRGLLQRAERKSAMLVACLYRDKQEGFLTKTKGHVVIHVI